jgi:hypothetical protein
MRGPKALFTIYLGAIAAGLAYAIAVGLAGH